MTADKLRGNPIDPGPERAVLIEPVPTRIEDSERLSGKVIRSRCTHASAEVSVKAPKLSLERLLKRHTHL